MHNKEDLISRFFTLNDDKQTKIVLDIPTVWWSRVVEYIWASKFAEENDTTLDSCSGICHPFKFYLTDKCKQVYACDNDNRIIDKDAILKDIELSLGKDTLDGFDKNYLDKVNYNCCDIAKTPYEDKKFNKIFSISVLEHLDKNKQQEAIKEYSRIIKDNGLLVLTIDYPNANPEDILKIAKKNGFALLGDIDLNMPDNAVSCDYWGHTLYCFRIVLQKLKSKAKKK